MIYLFKMLLSVVKKVERGPKLRSKTYTNREILI